MSRIINDRFTGGARNCCNCLFAGSLFNNTCFCSLKLRDVRIPDNCLEQLPRIREPQYEKRRGARLTIEIWMASAPEKIVFFAANYGKIRNQVIARELGIHEVRVPVVARQLGLTPDQHRKGWKKYGFGEKIIKLPPQVPTENLGKALSLAGLSPQQVTTSICALIAMNMN